MPGFRRGFNYSGHVMENRAMVTVTIDEATLNATRAALELRSFRLSVLVEDLQQRDNPNEDTQRALVWGIAALHETEIAREFFSELQVIDHPVDVTWTSA